MIVYPNTIWDTNITMEHHHALNGKTQELSTGPRSIAMSQITRNSEVYPIHPFNGKLPESISKTNPGPI